MMLKIMGAENAPDSDSRKTFQLIDHVSQVAFEREGDKAFVHIFLDRGDEDIGRFDVPGNCYLMNTEGKTIAQFGAAPYRAGPQ